VAKPGLRILALLLVLALFQRSQAPEVVDRAIGVADGDTITVLEASKERQFVAPQWQPAGPSEFS
jgi:hypothetical protein